MKTLEQFKQEKGIKSIDLLKGNGRMFAQVGNENLIVSSKCDLKKPLFVTPITQDKAGNPVVGVYALVNSVVIVVVSI